MGTTELLKMALAISRAQESH